MFFFVITDSYYDNCLAKNGEIYKKQNGEFGCLYFHTLSSFFSPKRGKIYDYEKSKEFCENMGGSLPIIKDRNEDQAMLKMLGGYVSTYTLYHHKIKFITLYILYLYHYWPVVFILG